MNLAVKGSRLVPRVFREADALGDCGGTFSSSSSHEFLACLVSLEAWVEEVISLGAFYCYSHWDNEIIRIFFSLMSMRQNTLVSK